MTFLIEEGDIPATLPLPRLIVRRGKNRHAKPPPICVLCNTLPAYVGTCICPDNEGKDSPFGLYPTSVRVR